MIRTAYQTIQRYVSGIAQAHKRRSVRSKVQRVDLELRQIRGELSRPMAQRKPGDIYSHVELEAQRTRLVAQKELLERVYLGDGDSRDDI